jgi:hypothetical protein
MRLESDLRIGLSFFHQGLTLALTDISTMGFGLRDADVRGKERSLEVSSA